MAELSGALGIQALSSARQSERSRGASFDSGLARKPTKPPARLSRVLYIPVHSSSELHVSIHDVSAGYKHVIGHAPMGGSEIIGDAVMGSRLFMTRLGTMNKPTAGAEGSKVQYAFDAVVGDTEASATLQRCPPGNAEQAVKISLPHATDDFELVADEQVHAVASFPVEDTTSSVGTARHPFYALPSRDGSEKLQWQIHPLETGPLRYTLVADPSEGDEDLTPAEDSIRAVYHQIGSGPSLSTASSEGVLLLPEVKSGDTSLTEEMVVASLLGLLWRVRGMEVKPRVDNVPAQAGKSFLKRIFKKD